MKISEQWKKFPIQGYPNYMVSNFGNVSSKSIGRNMKLSTHHKGYLKAQVTYMNVKKSFFVHRLVALAFIDNPNKYPQVNHLDGDKKNNCVSNLEWCSQSMNKKHSFAIGLESNRGENHPQSKLSNDDVLLIRKKFSNGHTRRMLGKEFGISPLTIKDIVTRKSWRHI